MAAAANRILTHSRTSFLKPEFPVCSLFADVFMEVSFIINHI